MKMKIVGSILSLIAIFSTTTPISATEGMWIPSMIKSLVSDDMAAMGMKISAEELYAINQSSVKDAVVHFNGGCTSVLVSNKGLLLTNHHCGYSRIQAHSSLENNYLKDGFWAANHDAELENPDMTATIIKEIRDVTSEILKDLPADATEVERAAMIKTQTEKIVAEATEGSHYSAYIRPFYYGNQFLLFINEEYKDIRLVGAPPSSIGKYGFDTDNWVWPRHTGDFSVFRIYADKDNKPAEYSEDNVPFKPNYHLPVSLDGVDENDFTLVYGFPGRTENYITGNNVEEVLEVINPLRLAMREASLGVIDKGMAGSELTKIQYAAKQSRISNAYKKWIGQSKGLIRHRAVAKKDSLENVFQDRVRDNEEWNEKYGSLLLEMSSLDVQLKPHNISRDYFIEFYYMGPEILRFSGGFNELVEMSKNKNVPDEEIEAWVKERLGKLGYFKNYDAQVDEDIMKAQIRHFLDGQPPLLFTIKLKDKKESLNEFVDRIYEETIFDDEAKLKDFLEGYKRNDYKKIEKDLAFAFSKRISDYYYDQTRPKMMNYVPTQDSLMRVWMSALMEVIPEKTYYPRRQWNIANYLRKGGRLLSV